MLCTPSYPVRVAVLLLLCGCLGALTLPRFNRRDIGPLGAWLVGRDPAGRVSQGDTPHYVRMVRYFRGEASRDGLATPFAYRPAIPWLAAKLPVRNPMTALNLVNLAGLAASMFFLHGWMRMLGHSYWWAVVGDGLFVFSFPVFYYGAIGLIDPAWMAVLSAGVYFLYRGQWVAFTGVLALGAWVRETTAWLLPVAAAYVALARPRHGWKKLALAGLLYLMGTLLVRVLFEDLPRYGWHPGAGYWERNLRVRALLAMVLSFGAPGLLMLCWWMNKQAGDLNVALVELAPSLAGVVVGIGLSLFACVAAHADGRFMWGASVFAMPFALKVMRQWGGRDTRRLILEGEACRAGNGDGG